MGGWVKIFSDSPFEMGTDADIRDGLASWSRGKLDHMIGVSVKSGDQHIAIKGAGEYWQSDDYEVVIGSSDSQRITRRIMKKLESEDRLFEEFTTEHSTMLSIYNVLTDGDNIARAEHLHILKKEMIDQWLVLEYHIPTKSVRWFISSHRV